MAKLTRKSYQRKAMVVGATAFAGVALVATGFAAWVISSSATKNVQGNVNVGTISEKSIEITDVKFKEVGEGTRDYFSFEPVKTDLSGRVRYDGKGNYENLSLVVTGKYKPASYVNNFSIGLHMGTVDKTTNKFQVDAEAEKRIEDAANVSNYIKLPACWAGATKGGDGVTFNTKGTEFTSTDGNGTITVDTDGVATFTYTISFEWGSHFYDETTKKNLNPSEFYDSDTGKKQDDTAFKTDLAAFYKAMTGIEYKPGETTAPTTDYTTMNFAVIIKADTSGSAAA